ncbi:hypothetical protein RFI_38158, partial [Reticulomyxa filosa]
AQLIYEQQMSSYAPCQELLDAVKELFRVLKLAKTTNKDVTVPKHYLSEKRTDDGRKLLLRNGVTIRKYDNKKQMWKKKFLKLSPDSCYLQFLSGHSSSNNASGSPTERYKAIEVENIVDILPYDGHVSNHKNTTFQLIGKKSLSQGGGEFSILFQLKTKEEFLIWKNAFAVFVSQLRKNQK